MLGYYWATFVHYLIQRLYPIGIRFVAGVVITLLTYWVRTHISGVSHFQEASLFSLAVLAPDWARSVGLGQFLVEHRVGPMIPLLAVRGIQCNFPPQTHC